MVACVVGVIYLIERWIDLKMGNSGYSASELASMGFLRGNSSSGIASRETSITEELSSIDDATEQSRGLSLTG
ncbi:unnamed protein product [Linum trigynum]|uniref:Uncharacterized protein n=1 Tax=Linum trigynum TaxID=586398 RepID=A0AAV2DD98_9ROSI